MVGEQTAKEAGRTRSRVAHVVVPYPFSVRLAAAYFVVHVAVSVGSDALQPHPQFVLWAPAAGLAVAFLLVAGLVYAPVVFVALVASSGPEAGIPSDVVVTVTIGALAGALRWFERGLEPFEAQASLTRLALFTVVITGIAAPLRSLALALEAGTRMAAQVGPATVLSLGFAAGIFVFTPFVVMYLGRPLAHAWERGASYTQAVWESITPTSKTQARSLALAGAILGACHATAVAVHAVYGFELYYWIFLPLIWIALQYGLAGAAAAVAAVGWALISGGLFLESTATSPFVEGPIFLAVLSLTTLYLGGTVTAKQEAEHALGVRELQVSSARRIANLGVWEWDVQTGAVRWSDEQSRMFGIEPDTFDGTFQSAIAPIHPDDRYIAIETTQQVLEERHGKTSEFRVVHPDGAIRHILNYGTVVFDDQDEPLCIRGVSIDVTERHQTADALRESERRYAMAVEVARAGVWEILPEENRIITDENLARVIGYEPGDLSDDLDDWIARIPSDDQEVVEANLKRVAAGESDTYHIEHRVRGKDGSIRWILVNGRVVEWDHGTPSRLVGASLDITERKAFEEALIESERRYRLVSDNVTDVVWTLDAEQRFTYVSPSDYALRGYTTEEVLTMTFEDALAPASRVLGRQTVAEIMANASSERIDDSARTVELEFRHRDGHTVWTESNINLMRDRDGRVLGVLGVSRDMTERRRAEQVRRALEAQVQQAQKLESLGVLAGGIAHDFNNLLLGVLGNAELARADTPEGSTAHECLDDIGRAADRAADLCKQLLAYSGRGKFVLQYMDVSEIVADITELLEVSISKKADLVYDFQHNLPAVEADATQFRQVAMNLITNASDALRDQSGTIRVITGAQHYSEADLGACVMAEGAKPGPYVYLEVSDTGTGMDKATVDRMFDPFFTTKETGHGLGMAAILGIVRSHGGAVEVATAPGQGARIRALFPATQKKAKPLHPHKSLPETGQGQGLILFVDDEAAVRSLGRRSLERAGFDVLIASDGAEGVDLFRAHAHAIGVVVLDMTMPKKNGLEAYEEIRRIRGDVRVILSSGYAEQEAVAAFEDDGLVGFIQKPYRPTQLVGMVRQTLENL